ncbi:uncharacterized protein YALI1_F05118g [Yarrowia lipolytica]|uniref:Uncharacterized protein n=1 Tax=Yarrowia lipolytica TaxID=4952 RepID=A0A1D8NLU2_YARLL|nr:hypothetical protein YALI1_F05118g [Yarrowia lipolytica]
MLRSTRARDDFKYSTVQYLHDTSICLNSLQTVSNPSRHTLQVSAQTDNAEVSTTTTKEVWRWQVFRACTSLSLSSFPPSSLHSVVPVLLLFLVCCCFWSDFLTLFAGSKVV